MREKKIPTIECNAKTIAWLVQLPVNQINIKNLEYRNFNIAYKLLNRTICINVLFEGLTAKLKLYYNFNKNRKGQQPTHEVEVHFILDRVALEKLQGKWTPDVTEFLTSKIIPILRFLMSSEKYQVILKKNVNSNVYHLVRTSEAFGTVFELPDELEKTARELSRNGIVVSITVDNNKWLETAADKVRKAAQERGEEAKSPIFNNERDAITVKYISAINIIGKYGKIFHLQTRCINNVVEIAYFEKRSGLQALLYADSSVDFRKSEIIYGTHDSEYIEITRKIIALVQNVLLYLRMWDVETSRNSDGSWRACEVIPWPFEL